MFLSCKGRPDYPIHLRYEQVDKEGPINMEDAAGFFANVFGGERFHDYVRTPIMQIS